MLQVKEINSLFSIINFSFFFLLLLLVVNSMMVMMMMMILLVFRTDLQLEFFSFSLIYL